jgi:hypothetical protein
MISMEDRLRIVLQETARQVPPESMPPLDLTRGVVADSRRGRHHASRTLTALAAAAAVAGIVVASAALAAHSRPSQSAAAARHPDRPQSALAAGTPQPLPSYFLVLTGTGSPYYDNPLHAAIGATASGKILAVITPPAPYGTFIGVTAAADDRTFVLAAQAWQPHNTSSAVGINAAPVTFFLVRFNPVDSQPTLTRLPIPPIPGSAQLAGLALAPDGGQLAVATDDGLATQQLTMYSVATGAARTWTAHVANTTLGGAAGAQNMIDPQGLSWTADGRTLAYDWWGPKSGVELLDVAGTSGSLLADSRLVVPVGRTGCLGDAMITPDGSAIVCSATAPFQAMPALNQRPTGRPTVSMTGPVPAASVQTVRMQVGFAEFSARTGALLRTLDQRYDTSSSPLSQQVLWSDASGSELITESALPYWNRVAVIRAGKLTLLPLADQPTVPAVVW